MTQILKHFSPQPFTDIAANLFVAARADKYNRTDDNFRSAAKVIGYALSRIAMAGAIYYGMNKYHADAFRTTIAGALISAPATALFWSGRLLVSGAEALKAGYRTPFTRDFAMGAFKVLAALPLSGCYKGAGFRLGLVEWKVLPTAFGSLERGKRPY